MERDLSQFVSALRRIPVFQGLNPRQALAILKACEQRALAEKERLCRYGEPSNEMYILLSGLLSVRVESDTQIARIAPIATVGEMGLFTDEPRSATVVAVKPSVLLTLHRTGIEILLRQNPETELCISRNLIRILSQRLREANGEIAYLSDLLSDGQAGVDSVGEEMQPPKE